MRNCPTGAIPFPSSLLPNTVTNGVVGQSSWLGLDHKGNKATRRAEKGQRGKDSLERTEQVLWGRRNEKPGRRERGQGQGVAGSWSSRSPGWVWMVMMPASFVSVAEIKGRLEGHGGKEPMFQISNGVGLLPRG